MRIAPVRFDWNPEYSIYASESFLRTLGDEYGWIGGTDDSGKLRCVLPFTIVRKANVRMARFRVETIPLAGTFGIDEEKAFLNRTVEYFRSAGADMIIPATTNSIFRTYPDGAVAAPYGTHIIDLTQSEENLLGNLNQSHRRKVRLGMKNGVNVRNGMEYIHASYTLIRDTLKRSRMGFMSDKAFTNFVQGLNENVKIFVADYRGKIQGCAIYPFSNHSAYYLYGGSVPEPDNGALHLLHWEAIRHFRELGVKRYDFVGTRIQPKKGSKQEGLMMFKQRFGGQLVQGYMWKYAIRPIKSTVYSLAVRFLRGGDIVDHEKHKLSAGSPN